MKGAEIVRELTAKERATYGECPICNAKPGWCCNQLYKTQPTPKHLFGWPISCYENNPGVHAIRLSLAPTQELINESYVVLQGDK